MAVPSTTRTPTRRPTRGRPQKYGQPAKVVAVTLPTDTIDALRGMDADLGWAIVTLVNATRGAGHRPPQSRQAELVEVGSGQHLIVVPASSVKRLPGVQTVPLSDGQSFLALEPGQGMADLELAVSDRLEHQALAAGDREVLTGLREQLRRWRKDPKLRFSTRTIILASRARP